MPGTCQSVTIIVFCLLFALSGIGLAIAGLGPLLPVGVINIFTAALGLFAVIKKQVIALYVFAVLHFLSAAVKMIIGIVAFVSIAAIPEIVRTEFTNQRGGDPLNMYEERQTERVYSGVAVVVGLILTADGIIALIVGVLSVLLAKNIQKMRLVNAGV